MWLPGLRCELNLLTVSVLWARQTDFVACLSRQSMKRILSVLRGFASGVSSG